MTVTFFIILILFFLSLIIEIYKCVYYALETSETRERLERVKLLIKSKINKN